MSENCKLILGDCLEKLREMPDNSIDLVLTDPPYALVSPNSKSGGGFMGKEWDSEFPKAETWLEIKRVMKAGAFCVFTMIPRQDCLLNCLMTLRETGFEMGFSPLFHLFHTGFPKASDVAFGIDLKFFREQFEAKHKRKPTREEIREWKKLTAGEKLPNHRISSALLELGFQGGKGVGHKHIIQTTEAKRWHGWKSYSLKPSLECIVVAQKPRSEKTIVGQVLATGTGAVNVGECRIPYAGESEKKHHDSAWSNHSKSKTFHGQTYRNMSEVEPSLGRFPANLVVSGESLKGEETSQTAGVYPHQTANKVVDFAIANNRMSYNVGDKGSPNRFYSLDAWAEKRNITLTEDSAFFDVPKPSKAEKNAGLDGFEERDKRFFRSHGGAGEPIGTSIKYPDGSDRPKTNKQKNEHPTTKPVKLFSYLVTLFCQPKGLILDPFMGSGSTGIAALKMGFRFIGIEKEKEYFEIARARIKPHLEQTKLGEGE